MMDVEWRGGGLNLSVLIEYSFHYLYIPFSSSLSPSLTVASFSPSLESPHLGETFLSGAAKKDFVSRPKHQHP